MALSGKRSMLSLLVAGVASAAWLLVGAGASDALAVDRMASADALASDDHCQVGDEQCSLNALQLRAMAVKSTDGAKSDSSVADNEAIEDDAAVADDADDGVRCICHKSGHPFSLTCAIYNSNEEGCFWNCAGECAKKGFEYKDCTTDLYTPSVPYC
mmetsp:Transcript_85502/g.222420  ORF Transcript_85502/g.222420 Transcript_85502/m.222420 type:complete len:157 (+) Transcript_85502:74-544(+)